MSTTISPGPISTAVPDQISNNNSPAFNPVPDALAPSASDTSARTQTLKAQAITPEEAVILANDAHDQIGQLGPNTASPSGPDHIAATLLKKQAEVVSNPSTSNSSSVLPSIDPSLIHQIQDAKDAIASSDMAPPEKTATARKEATVAAAIVADQTAKLSAEQGKSQSEIETDWAAAFVATYNNFVEMLLPAMHCGSTASYKPSSLTPTNEVPMSQRFPQQVEWPPYTGSEVDNTLSLLNNLKNGNTSDYFLEAVVDTPQQIREHAVQAQHAAAAAAIEAIECSRQFDIIIAARDLTLATQGSTMSLVNAEARARRERKGNLEKSENQKISDNTTLLATEPSRMEHQR